MMDPPLIFERSVPGRRAYRIPHPEGSEPAEALIPVEQLRPEGPPLPEVSELDIVQHYTSLSQRNFSVDTHFYPLGSCTMKYNPRVHERVAALPGFAWVHPLQPARQVQGLLALLHELEQLLCAITGMQAFSLQPAAGAQGELTGLKMIAAYHQRKRRLRSTILIPDSAHGTNPASAALCGLDVVQVRSGRDGLVDLQDLKAKLTRDVAGLMLTNPNTLGLFEREIKTIAALLHEHDALVYMDGANLNALLGIARPGDMGVDVLQLNLHKTFSTPHGGGGPGAGPVGVTAALEPFLPVPRLRRVGRRLAWTDRSRHTIGRVHGFVGNVGVLVRAYIYIRTLGREGLRRTGERAVLNANYLRRRLADTLPTPFDGEAMHEFVATLKSLKAQGVSAWDVAKRLLDYGFYAPTVYFPLIVDEAFMIEPTETASKETLNAFAAALRRIVEEARTDPDRVRRAPERMVVQRVDEVRAARTPEVRWRPGASAPGRAPSSTRAPGTAAE